MQSQVNPLWFLLGVGGGGGFWTFYRFLIQCFVFIWFGWSSNSLLEVLLLSWALSTSSLISTLWCCQALRFTHIIKRSTPFYMSSAVVVLFNGDVGATSICKSENRPIIQVSNEFGGFSSCLNSSFIFSCTYFHHHLNENCCFNLHLSPQDPQTCRSTVSRPRDSGFKGHFRTSDGTFRISQYHIAK